MGNGETMDAARERLTGLGYAVADQPNPWHVKIGRVNYWPTTGKWYDESTGDRGSREATLLRHLAAARGRAAEAREIDELKAEGKLK